jgi:hypothetical protein
VYPTVATDVAVAGTPTTTPPTLGGHTITYTSANHTEIVDYSGTIPNLTYEFGIPGNGAIFNYNEIDIVGATYTGTPAPTSIAVELIGTGTTQKYDVRLYCAAPAALSATAQTFRCLFPTNGITFVPVPAPSYYIANSYGAPSGSYTTTYTAATHAYGRPTASAVPPVTQQITDTGLFTPIAGGSVYIVLGFAGAGDPGGVLSFVGLEGIQ